MEKLSAKKQLKEEKLQDVDPKPYIFSLFKQGYSFENFKCDLSAGIVVGIVAVPLALAFAVASGVPPQQGLYTAIIAGFLIALLGGSNVQVSGPTGAFVVIIAGVVEKHGLIGLQVATIMAGIMLVILGLFKAGAILRYIPYPLIVGFTAGIALIIATSQIKDFFGLQTQALPSNFFLKWGVYFKSFSTINFSAVGISVVSLLFLFFFKFKKIPSSLFVILFSTVATKIFSLNIETIGSRFGEIPTSLPPLTLPEIPFADLNALISAAIAIALLGGIESLLSATVAEGMTHKKHDPNMELIAQGFGNVVSPLFGGIPATGAIARTATNIRCGGLTPLSAIIHSITVLLIMLAVGRYVALIPMASLAAILLFVAWHMSEAKSCMWLIKKAPKSDISIFITTFLLTIAVDLSVAIEVGILMSACLFVKRMEGTSNFHLLSDEERIDASEILRAPHLKTIPKNLLVFAIDGPLFYGVVDRFKRTSSQITTTPKGLIVLMHNVPSVDASGLHVLDQFLKSFKHRGSKIIFVGVRFLVKKAMKEALQLDEHDFFANAEDAFNALTHDERDPIIWGE